jgi:hypothetical protein
VAETRCLCDNKSRARPGMVTRVGVLPFHAYCGHLGSVAPSPIEQRQRRTGRARGSFQPVPAARRAPTPLLVSPIQQPWNVTEDSLGRDRW